MAKAISNAARELLSHIVSFGMQGTYLADSKELARLEEEGYAEVNRAVANDAGEAATRATQEGVSLVEQINGADEAYFRNDDSTEAAPVGNTAKPIVSDIVSDVPMPERTTTRTRAATTYPIDKLEVGQSFFVVATDERPKPWSSLGSTLNSAHKRHGTPTGEMTENKNGKPVQVLNMGRKFEALRVADGAAWGYPGQTGAAVFRVEVSENETCH